MKHQDDYPGAQYAGSRIMMMVLMMMMMIVMIEDCHLVRAAEDVHIRNSHSSSSSSLSLRISLHLLVLLAVVDCHCQCHAHNALCHRSGIYDARRYSLLLCAACKHQSAHRFSCFFVTGLRRYIFKLHGTFKGIRTKVCVGRPMTQLEGIKASFQA